MGSRLRENPKQIFELFVEIGRPSEGDKEPFILQQYPAEYGDKDVLKSVSKFAFPCANESFAVDHFTFVLTDIEGKFKFGFCRHATGALTCLCIVSYLPWYEIFYKLLNSLADILNGNENSHVYRLLEATYQHEVPTPGSEVIAVTSNCTEKFVFTAPNPTMLPEIPQSRNLTEYYSAVSSANMVVIFVSMLFERRVLITSKKLSRLTACIHGAASLLYPLHWQHLYIPVLPQHLIDYCSAPMPYLIGIHSSLFQKLHKQELGDAVILDADTDTVVTEFDDIASMPSNVVSALKKSLRSQQAGSMMGDGLARIFLKAMVVVLGSYRDGLRFRPGEQIIFDSDAFIMSRSPSMKPFLEKLLQLQTFQQFVAERLDLLNSGQGFTDEFEIETNSLADKWKTDSRYKDWLQNMKKQRKKGKDKWIEFTSKANPAVKLAVQSVKDRSKKAYHDIKSKMDENKKEELAENSIVRNRPSTVTGIGHVINRNRPARPSPLSKEIVQRHTLLHRSIHDKSRQYKVMTDFDIDTVDTAPVRGNKRMSSRDDSDLLQYQRVSLDLMHDPDIQNMMKKSYSLEDFCRLPEEEEEEAEDALVCLRMNTGHVTENDHLAVTVTHASTLSSSVPDIRCVQSIDCSVGQAEEMVTEQPLIQLNSVFESECAVKETSGFGVCNTMSLVSKSVTLPRNATLSGTQTMWSRNNDAHEDSFGEFVSPSTSSSCMPILECITAPSVTPSSGEELATTPVTRSGPVPKPRSSLKRSIAFHGRPAPSVVRKSSSATSLQATDGHMLKDARSAFMESDGSKHSLHSLNHLEQFDPLLTGQLAVDSTSLGALGTCGGTSSGSEVKQEVNLLREWNLDFSRVSSALTGRDKAPPVVAPKPPPKTHHLVNHAPVGYAPPVQPRMICDTLPAQFKGHSQLSYMPPRQTRPPPPRANYTPKPSLWRGQQKTHMGVQSLINTFEKTSTPRDIPEQHQFSTHTLGAAPALHSSVPNSNTRVNVNQTADLSRNLLQDPFGDILNVTTNTSTSPSLSPRDTWTTFD